MRMMMMMRSALMRRRLSFCFLVIERKREKAFVFEVPPPVMGELLLFVVVFLFFSFSFLFGFAVFRHGVRRFGGPFYGFLCYKEKRKRDLHVAVGHR